jgi:hypothetical protein
MPHSGMLRATKEGSGFSIAMDQGNKPITSTQKISE